MVKISVIIPVYNAENCISETLNSILNSSLHEIEVICVNDCSTDNSLKVLQEFSLKDSRISIINNIKNVGTALAKNKGLNVAKGEFIAFCDADDLVDKDFYVYLYKKAIGSSADVTVGKITIQPFNVTYYNVINSVCARFYTENKLCCMGPLVGFLIKRSLIEENSLRFRNFQAIEDNDLALRIGAVANKFSRVEEESFYRYRLNVNEENSVTRNNNFKLNSTKFDCNLVEALDVIFSELKQKDIPNKLLSELCALLFVDKFSIVLRCSSWFNKLIIARKFYKLSFHFQNSQEFYSSIKKQSPLIYSFLKSHSLLKAYFYNSVWYRNRLFKQCLAKTDSNFYFWGASDFLKEHLRKYSSKYSSLGIIDIAKAKISNNEELYGLKIYSPEVLKNKEINVKAIVIAVTHHQEEIKASIEKLLKEAELSNVKVITWL